MGKPTKPTTSAKPAVTTTSVSGKQGTYNKPSVTGKPGAQSNSNHWNNPTTKGGEKGNC